MTRWTTAGRTCSPLSVRMVNGLLLAWQIRDARIASAGSRFPTSRSARNCGRANQRGDFVKFLALISFGVGPREDGADGIEQLSRFVKMTLTRVIFGLGKGNACAPIGIAGE